MYLNVIPMAMSLCKLVNGGDVSIIVHAEDSPALGISRIEIRNRELHQNSGASVDSHVSLRVRQDSGRVDNDLKPFSLFLDLCGNFSELFPENSG